MNNIWWQHGGVATEAGHSYPEPTHKFLLNAKIHHFTKQGDKLYKHYNIVITYNSYTTL